MTTIDQYPDVKAALSVLTESMKKATVSQEPSVMSLVNDMFVKKVSEALSVVTKDSDTLYMLSIYNIENSAYHQKKRVFMCLDKLLWISYSSVSGNMNLDLIIGL
jgi:hypothetical protein